MRYSGVKNNVRDLATQDDVSRVNRYRGKFDRLVDGPLNDWGAPEAEFWGRVDPDSIQVVNGGGLYNVGNKVRVPNGDLFEVTEISGDIQMRVLAVKLVGFVRTRNFWGGEFPAENLPNLGYQGGGLVLYFDTVQEPMSKLVSGVVGPKAGDTAIVVWDETHNSESWMYECFQQPNGNLWWTAVVRVDSPDVDMSLYEAVGNRVAVSAQSTASQYPTAKSVWDLGLQKLNVSDIEDVLTSSSTVHALSANMGRELAVRVDAANGSGGFIPPHDFGTDSPTQDALTAYAMAYIFGADASNHTSAEIFNGTKVQNLNDRRVWQLANTPDTSPAVFEWMEALAVSGAQRDFTANPIATGEITDGAVTSDKLATAIQTLLGYIDTGGSLTAALAGKQDTEAGKGLSTNDFGNTYKSLLEYVLGSNTVTTLNSVNLEAKQLTVATVSENQTLSLTGVPPTHIAHILVKNGGASDVTVAVPTTGAYKSRLGTVATVPGSGSIEFSILYDASASMYIISLVEDV